MHESVNSHRWSNLTPPYHRPAQYQPSSPESQSQATNEPQTFTQKEIPYVQRPSYTPPYQDTTTLPSPTKSNTSTSTMTSPTSKTTSLPDSVIHGRYHYEKPSFAHRFMEKTGLGKLGSKMKMYHPTPPIHHYTFDIRNPTDSGALDPFSPGAPFAPSV